MNNTNNNINAALINLSTRNLPISTLSSSDHCTLDCDIVKAKKIIMENDEPEIVALLNSSQFSELFLRTTINEKAICESIDFNELLNTIVKTQILSETFIKDIYKYDFDKSLLYANQTLSEDFLITHLSDYNNSPDKIKILKAILLHQKLSNSFLLHHFDEFYKDETELNEFITTITSKQKLSFEFITKYKDYINPDILIFNYLIDPATMKKAINLFDDKITRWDYISWHYNISEETILAHIDSIDFTSPLLSTRKYNDPAIPVFIKIKYNIDTFSSTL